MPFGKLLPREEQYFTLFAQMTSYINDAAKTLVEIVTVVFGEKRRAGEKSTAYPPAPDETVANTTTARPCCNVVQGLSHSVGP